MSENSAIRINAYLRDLGVCSRRQADELVESGRIQISNGGSVRTAILGDKISGSDRLLIDGKEIGNTEEKVYILLYKPVGVVCTSNRKEGKSVLDLTDHKGYLTYAGRLDKDSEGLLLLTNDGLLCDALMRSANAHEKEYSVKVDKDINAGFLKKMSSGVDIGDAVTRPCKVKAAGNRSFNIILTQGLNRQIRRMCSALGYNVLKLKRIRIVNLSCNGMKSGDYRYLEENEINSLKRACGL